MKGTGLVLEGGGMRGLYTAGVLEYFLEQKLFFPYVVGVSAGACMGASYVSRQEGRNKQVNIGLATDKRFVSLRNYLLRRELFGMDFLFNEIPNQIVPFDFDTFFTVNDQFIVGTTDCETGEPVYFHKNSIGKEILPVIRASSSIPFIARPVKIAGRFLLDGGLSDPIPIQKSIQDGNHKHVIIMTKSKTYRKKPSRLRPFIKRSYYKYPNIARLLSEQHIYYERACSTIETELNKGKAFVIQPSREVAVGMIERNQKKLTNLYELGYEDARVNYNKLIEFLHDS
ncbi:patatin-like phospholipase family protein [Halalkalibacter urbisdiaboli]|uniref:patatin-like phospholipase family protein n=1 Tax=Halalkalibacter urbisdiaboli TaxID=1960589 RepID=UPI000B43EB00|nr:patatin family protein [Halalkalibacter urbisdiaboli]